MLNYTIIKNRKSSRTYTGKEMDEQCREQLLAFLDENYIGPFGNRIVFHLLDMKGRKPGEISALTTYGVIKNAPHYLAGVVKDKPGAMVDFGFVMEKAILYATSLGLGTCWIGGTFKRSGLGAELGLGEDELIPCMTPVGYPADRHRFLERVMRAGAGSDKRKQWETLFFNSSFKQPLTSPHAGRMARALDAVRLGPSASNKQPWRIVMEKEHNTFHFYLNRNKAYDSAMGPISLQRIDMGIAMCHFEVEANELGHENGWKVSEPDLGATTFEYIATWENKTDRSTS